MARSIFTPRRSSMFDPQVERYLIADEGEVVIDEVAKHWVAVVLPVLELIAAFPVLILGAWLPPQTQWVTGVVALIIALHALWRILGVHMDRFVITNMRVFRVHGILSQSIATMPISRILDISVRVSIIGRICDYGNFVFESAAQEQGLREIRYVGAPRERGLTIQRVIQRSGLRGGAAPRPASPSPAPAVTPAAQPFAPAQTPWWRTPN